MTYPQVLREDRPPEPGLGVLWIEAQYLQDRRRALLSRSRDDEKYACVVLLPWRCLRGRVCKVIHRFHRFNGIRKAMSTSHAVMELIQKISNATDNKKHAVGVFIDLKKAFDTVDHEILIKKLNFYGMRGV